MPGFYGATAHFYDAENADKRDDIDMYLGLAQRCGGPILEIGCGTGRVTCILAEQGYEVHGIDNEAAMLKIAEQRRKKSPALAKKISLYHGDVLTYSLDRQFPLVIVPYNTLMHFLEEEARITLLKQLRHWTADGGLLALDLPNAGEVFASQESDSVMFERTFLMPETGHLVMQQSVSTLDRTTQL